MGLSVVRKKFFVGGRLGTSFTCKPRAGELPFSIDEGSISGLADHSSADKEDDFVGDVVEFAKIFGE